MHTTMLTICGHKHTHRVSARKVVVVVVVVGGGIGGRARVGEG